MEFNIENTMSKKFKCLKIVDGNTTIDTGFIQDNNYRLRLIKEMLQASYDLSVDDLEIVQLFEEITGLYDEVQQ